MSTQTSSSEAVTYKEDLSTQLFNRSIEIKEETINKNENDSESIYIQDLLSDLTVTSEDIILEMNGYIKTNKITNTLQGELFKAKELSTGQYVAIKKTNKSLHNEHISIQDDTTFFVSENIIREAIMIQHLTVDNTCIGKYIIQFINFFESDTDYYLVLEYIESEINLKQFVAIAHKCIEKGKLKLRHYQKVIQYLYWQLLVTIQWLHDSMHVCHLDLCLENIMIKNFSFIEAKGFYKINPGVEIRLIDFGVCEVFPTEIDNYVSFKCNKQNLSLENESYLSPQQFGADIYDATSADIWSLGMILYSCLSGKLLYKPSEIWQCASLKTETLSVSLLNSGYWSLHNNKLKEYVNMNNKQIFNSDSFDLLVNLLNINEDKRLSAMGVLTHKWFKLYYKTFHERIEKKSIVQKEKLKQYNHKLRNLPFYKLSMY
eukprot:353913_1